MRLNLWEAWVLRWQYCTPNVWFSSIALNFSIRNLNGALLLLVNETISFEVWLLSTVHHAHRWIPLEGFQINGRLASLWITSSRVIESLGATYLCTLLYWSEILLMVLFKLKTGWGISSRILIYNINSGVTSLYIHQGLWHSLDIGGFD